MPLRLRALGRLALYRGGRALGLPPSRKARALLAYLALAPRPVARSRLCDLLWEASSDPRGELRWCLSRLRPLVDAGHCRLRGVDDLLWLDLSGCEVDALEVSRATEEGVQRLSAARAHELAARFDGDFLDGLESVGTPQFSAWLTAQRRRLRRCHALLLERLAASSEGDALGYAEKWLQLAPFERRAHELCLGALARCGRLQDAKEHYVVTVRLFEAEGLDWAPIRRAWEAVRAGRR